MTRKTSASKALDQHIGYKLKSYRLRQGMSQKQLSLLLGITYQQLHKYETGSNSIAASRLAEIAACLGITISQLFEGHGDHAELVLFAEESRRDQLLLARYFNQIGNIYDRQALRALITQLSHPALR